MMRNNVMWLLLAGCAAPALAQNSAPGTAAAAPAAQTNSPTRVAVYSG